MIGSNQVEKKTTKGSKPKCMATNQRSSPTEKPISSVMCTANGHAIYSSQIISRPILLLLFSRGTNLHVSLFSSSLLRAQLVSSFFPLTGAQHAILPLQTGPDLLFFSRDIFSLDCPLSLFSSYLHTMKNRRCNVIRAEMYQHLAEIYQHLKQSCRLLGCAELAKFAMKLLLLAQLI